MEKQEYKSKWDELAREIGAEIPPETIQREEAVAAPQPPAARSARPSDKLAESRAALPKKTPVDWDNLAGELGLPPAPPAEKPAEMPAEKPAIARVEPRRPEVRRQEEGQEPPRREPPRREAPQSRRPDRPPREQQERHARPEPRRDQRDQRDHREKRRPPRDVDADVAAEPEVRPAREQDRVEQRPERQAPPAPPREEPPKPAAVSLWHKIFGSPAEQSAKLVDDEIRPDATEPPNDRDESRDAGSGFADPHSDANAIAEHRDEFENGDELTTAANEGDPSDRQRGRPRRRRGRGRGRRSDTPQSEVRSTEPRDSQRPRRDHARPRPPERVERPERVESDDDIADTDLDDELLADDELGGLDDDVDDGDETAAGEGSTRSRSVLQRAIPSWDEAIGFIVDTNMQSRSQRRPPPRSGPRDGGGRGRPRGRRKP